MHKLTTRLKDFGRRTAAIGTLAMVSVPAFAAGESTEIIASFNEYKVEALLIVVAFCVVLWAIRGGTLLKPK